MQKTKSFARFVRVPENRAALLAVQDLASCLLGGKTCAAAAPLLLHGPPGTGKTHLVLALVREVTCRAGDLTVSLLAAADFDLVHDVALHDTQANPTDLLEAAGRNDLLIVEDVQHLPDRGVEALVQILDHRHARQRPTVVTSRTGPQRLGESFSARLTSRLGTGLVVALEPLQPASRRALLQDLAERRQLAVAPDVLSWLAENLNGTGRVLEGAIRQLESLVRQSSRPLDVPTMARHFADDVAATRPTMERIAQRVGGYFRVEPRSLQSRRRYRNAMRPRQVGMYLARRLSGLSLDQIGAYFGGRDHTTVLHACRKIEGALEHDQSLCGAVRQLQADLG